MPPGDNSGSTYTPKSHEENVRGVETCTSDKRLAHPKRSLNPFSALVQTAKGLARGVGSAIEIAKDKDLRGRAVGTVVGGAENKISSMKAALRRIQKRIEEDRLHALLREYQEVLVDVQIGCQLYEDAPQELRSRLWLALCDDLQYRDRLRPKGVHVAPNADDYTIADNNFFRTAKERDMTKEPPDPSSLSSSSLPATATATATVSPIPEVVGGIEGDLLDISGPKEDLGAGDRTGTQGDDVEWSDFIGGDRSCPDQVDEMRRVEGILRHPQDGGGGSDWNLEQLVHVNPLGAKPPESEGASIQLDGSLNTAQARGTRARGGVKKKKNVGGGGDENLDWDIPFGGPELLSPANDGLTDVGTTTEGSVHDGGAGPDTGDDWELLTFESGSKTLATPKLKHALMNQDLRRQQAPETSRTLLSPNKAFGGPAVERVGTEQSPSSGGNWTRKLTSPWVDGRVVLNPSSTEDSRGATSSLRSPSSSFGTGDPTDPAFDLLGDPEHQTSSSETEAQVPGGDWSDGAQVPKILPVVELDPADPRLPSFRARGPISELIFGGCRDEAQLVRRLWHQMLEVHLPAPTRPAPDSRYATLTQISIGMENVDEEIRRDIHRTFPEHPLFAHERGQTALFNVLKAYAVHDLEVGYCQGMAFVAGCLLMYVPEEAAFHLLRVLMAPREGGGANMRSMYLPGLEALQQMMSRLEWLVKRHLPRLAAHLHAVGIPAVLYASQWFLTAFSNPFPPSFACRVLDVMLTERSMSVMLCIALCILAAQEDKLLGVTSFEEVIGVIKVQPVVEWGHEQLRKVLNQAVAIPLTDDDLEEIDRAIAKEKDEQESRDKCRDNKTTGTTRDTARLGLFPDLDLLRLDDQDLIDRQGGGVTNSVSSLQDLVDLCVDGGRQDEDDE